MNIAQKRGGRFIHRGWSVNGATFAILGAIMVPSVIAAGLLDHPVIVVGLIAVACGAHQAWSTIVFTVASDLFPSRAAGSVAGFGGFKAGMVSIVTAELTGRLLNANPGYYLPVFLVAAALYPISLACLTCPIRRWNERGCRAREDTQSRDPARAPGPPERDRLFVRARTLSGTETRSAVSICVIQRQR